ncbi:hypothetical protein QBC47DRAFT_418458 [Echria macrotheca]|uniref:Uncharacterized protein n=1 Tax=Echria macrotheca TaxID=438768 RepID=A0AAJ0F6H9_9PEZI|nr:hypothetical protein QBC47DRAFT_418458 [Echria macrotheca]
MLDAQEMRRRWSDKTNAVFGRSDYHESYSYGPLNQELELDFQNCRSIVFMDGEGRRGGEDLLLMARGSGHVTLPKGVQVRVEAGSVKITGNRYGRSEADRDSGIDTGSSVVSASYGGRAPPPTRATSYAGSSASSAYRSAVGQSHAGSNSTFRPSPPRDIAAFSRAGSHVGTLANARRVPLPPSSAGVDDWEVVEELDGDWDMDNRSVAPSESVSSVGERNRRNQYSDSYY